MALELCKDLAKDKVLGYCKGKIHEKLKKPAIDMALAYFQDSKLITSFAT